MVASHLDPEAFAQACADLYTDEKLWVQTQESAISAVRETCDGTTFRETLRRALSVDQDSALARNRAVGVTNESNPKQNSGTADDRQVAPTIRVQRHNKGSNQSEVRGS